MWRCLVVLASWRSLCLPSPHRHQPTTHTWTHTNALWHLFSSLFSVRIITFEWTKEFLLSPGFSFVCRPQCDQVVRHCPNPRCLPVKRRPRQQADSKRGDRTGTAPVKKERTVPERTHFTVATFGLLLLLAIHHEAMNNPQDTLLSLPLRKSVSRRKHVHNLYKEPNCTTDGPPFEISCSLEKWSK